MTKSKFETRKTAKVSLIERESIIAILHAARKGELREGDIIATCVEDEDLGADPLQKCLRDDWYDLLQKYLRQHGMCWKIDDVGVRVCRREK